jgi:hypothetical protein
VHRGGPQGPAITGAQCLVYFLGFKVPVEVEVGQDMRVQEVGPFLDVNGDMLSGEGDLEEKLADPTVTLVDKYGNPVHYDDLSTKDTSGKYLPPKELSDQHLEGGEMVSAPDPRKPKTGGALDGRNKGAYDLWSHGFKIGDPTDDITNWK